MEMMMHRGKLVPRYPVDGPQIIEDMVEAYRTREHRAIEHRAKVIESTKHVSCLSGLRDVKSLNHRFVGK